MRRRLQRRSKLVVVKTKAKNEIHAALMRRLITKPAVSGPLRESRAAAGSSQLELPAEEQETVEGCLRQLDFCEAEIAEIEQRIANRGARARRRSAG